MAAKVAAAAAALSACQIVTACTTVGWLKRKRRRKCAFLCKVMLCVVCRHPLPGDCRVCLPVYVVCNFDQQQCPRSSSMPDGQAVSLIVTGLLDGIWSTHTRQKSRQIRSDLLQIVRNCFDPRLVHSALRYSVAVYKKLKFFNYFLFI